MCVCATQVGVHTTHISNGFCSGDLKKLPTPIRETETAFYMAPYVHVHPRKVPACFLRSGVSIQMHVFDPGSDPDVREKLRSFMGHPNCRESFGFEEGKHYLIMGKSIDLPVAEGKYVNSSINHQGRHGEFGVVEEGKFSVLKSL